METTPTVQNFEIQKLSTSLAAIDALKTTVVEIANKCNAIVITDDTSLAMAQQVLGDLNDRLKNVDAKRAELKKPALDYGREIDAAAKVITNIADPVIAAGKKKIADYAKKKEAERQAEIARIAAEEEAKKQQLTKVVDFIGKIEADVKNRIMITTTKEAAVILQNSLVAKWPADNVFGQLLDQSKLVKVALLSSIKQRIEYFEALEKNAGNEAAIAEINKLESMRLGAAQQESKVIAQETVAQAAVVTEAIQEQAVVATTVVQDDKVKGIVNNWKFELNDIHKVPTPWLTFDEAKVKEWLKENKGALKDGDIINGMRFFIEQLVRL